MVRATTVVSVTAGLACGFVAGLPWGGEPSGKTAAPTASTSAEPPSKIAGSAVPPPPDREIPADSDSLYAKLDALVADPAAEWRAYEEPLQALATHSPEAAVAWAAENLPPNKLPGNLSRAILRPLAARDAAAAVRLVREAGDSIDANTMADGLGFTVEGIPLYQFQAFADEAALIEDPGARATVLGKTLETWARLAPERALRWVRSQPIGSPELVSATLLGAAVSAEGFHAASDLLERVKPDACGAVWREVASNSELTRADPRAMLEILRTHGREGELPAVLGRWAHHDPMAAAAAAETIAVESIRKDAYARIASTWASAEPVLAFEWKQSLKP